jgi:hypothetical protein
MRQSDLGPGGGDTPQIIADRQTGGLAAIAVVLALVVVGLALVHELQHSGRIEDCMMAGRTNCDPGRIAGMINRH